MNRLERLYAVSEEIRRRSPAMVSAPVLAERFGVSRRTMERDLASLRNAGVPLYATAGRSGGQAVLNTGNGRHVVSLSAEEITGLLMAVTASIAMPFGDAATAGALKILESLPEETQVVVSQLRDKIRVSVPDRVAGSAGGRAGVDPDASLPTHRIRRVIEEAVRLGHVVNIDYVDRGAILSSRPVEAVGFYRGESSWFLIGWCRLREDRRLFSLNRIQRANLTTERFAARDVEESLGWVPSRTITPDG